MSALELCFQFVLPLLQQVPLCLLWHLVSQMDEFLDKVFICDDSNVERGFAKTFSCDPHRFHVTGSKRLSQLSMERGLGIPAG